MISSRKTKFLIILLLILVLNFGAANFAHAGAASWFFGELIDITAEAVFNIVGAILAVIGLVLGLILALEGMILDYVLSLTNFSKAGVVEVGWKITRDLANMFFILIMIWIAFTTILQIETYRTKELVTRLIIVALLINFSLVIAGVIVDFTQVITNYFISQASGGGTVEGAVNLSASLAKGLQISSYYEPSKAAGMQDVLAKAASVPLMVVAGSAFAVIFSGLAIFVFAAAIILFVVRIVALWFLMIVSPIAWAASIMPDTKHLWDRWWKEFLRWAFFAPAYSFFIYLALLIVQMNGLQGQWVGEHALRQWGMLGDKPVSPLAANSSPSAVLNMVLVIVILIAGIKVAESMGAYGADTTMKYAKKWGNQAKDYTGRMGRRAAVATGEKISAKLPEGARTGIQRFAGLPGVRQAVRPLRRFEEQEREARAKRVSDAKERVKNWTKENIAAEIPSIIDPQARAGALLALSEKWQGLGSLGREEKISGLKTLQNLGMEKELMAVLRKDPSLAPTVGKTIKDVVERITPADIKDLTSNIFTDPKNPEVGSEVGMEIAKFLNPSQLDAVWNTGLSDAFMIAFKGMISKGVKPNPQQLKYFQKSLSWSSVVPEDILKQAGPIEPSGKTKEETKEEPIIKVVGAHAKLPPPEERK